MAHSPHSGPPQTNPDWLCKGCANHMWGRVSLASLKLIRIGNPLPVRIVVFPVRSCQPVSIRRPFPANPPVSLDEFLARPLHYPSAVSPESRSDAMRYRPAPWGAAGCMTLCAGVGPGLTSRRRLNGAPYGHSRAPMTDRSRALDGGTGRLRAPSGRSFVA